MPVFPANKKVYCSRQNTRLTVTYLSGRRIVSSVQHIFSVRFHLFLQIQHLGAFLAFSFTSFMSGSFLLRWGGQFQVMFWKNEREIFMKSWLHYKFNKSIRELTATVYKTEHNTFSNRSTARSVSIWLPLPSLVCMRLSGKSQNS